MWRREGGNGRAAARRSSVEKQEARHRSRTQANRRASRHRGTSEATSQARPVTKGRTERGTSEAASQAAGAATERGRSPIVAAARGQSSEVNWGASSLVASVPSPPQQRGESRSRPLGSAPSPSAQLDAWALCSQVGGWCAAHALAQRPMYLHDAAGVSHRFRQLHWRDFEASKSPATAGICVLAASASATPSSTELAPSPSRCCRSCGYRPRRPAEQRSASRNGSNRAETKRKLRATTGEAQRH